MPDTGLVQVLTDPDEIVHTQRRARREFLDRLSPGGLTVTEDFQQKWWPLAGDFAADLPQSCR